MSSDDDDPSDDRKDRDRKRKRSSDGHRERRRSRDRSPDRKERRRSRDRSSDRHRDRRRSRDRSSDRREGKKSRDRSSDRHRDRRRRSQSPRSRSRSRDRRKDKDRRRRSRDRRDRDKDTDKDEKSKPATPLRRSGPLPSQAASFAINTTGEAPPPEKEKPNFKPTGVLAALSNQVAKSDGSTIILKYHEPPEARKPPSRDQWKLFVFKGQDVVDTVELNHRSCWLIGRELAVADLPAEHPSVSKQHAVVQFRYVEKRDEFGERKGKVKPYLIDLESANGTFLNGERLEGGRYVEVRGKDIIKFARSEREYVVMFDRD